MSIASRALGTWSSLSRGAKVSLIMLAVLTLVAIFGPALAPHDPLERVGDAMTPPGTDGFLLGTDQSGRDQLSRTLEGVRTTWLGAVVVLLATATFGAVVGVWAGSTRGVVDTVLMRVTDVFLSLPSPIVAIAVVAAIGASFGNALLAIAIVWWPWYARIVRNEVAALSARPHVEAARLAGAQGVRLRTHHLLPGALPTLVVTATLDVGALILTLTALSFLGLGAPDPAPELGAMIASGSSYVLDQPWLVLVPSVAITLMTLCAGMAGDTIGGMLGRRR
jgi:peptide/nickel transport system permease protein